MRQHCIYLRKSRADCEAEQRGEGETLARHEAALLELALRRGLQVTQVYREVVSGETLAARPAMQKLLSEVEQGRWAGVLVMEVERLARGDTIDQGLVAQAFRYSNTRIITPGKTYDPTDEFDEEYFEFGLFMSRREYKAINRRLQRGRLASVHEGKYVGNRAPYGYNRVKIPGDKGFTLEIDPERAAVIRLVYDLFVNGELQPDGSRRQLGAYALSRRLNDMNIPSYTGRGWGQATVRDILINPVYTGKIRWNWRKTVTQMTGGQRAATRPRQPLSDCELVDGLHEAIIPDGLWQQAQQAMRDRAVPATPGNRVTQNPLSGLIVCGKCGRKMSRRVDTRGKTPPSLICAATSCRNVSSYLHYVEERVLTALAAWLAEYKVQLRLQQGGPAPQLEAKASAVRYLEESLAGTRQQADRLHDLLEQGVYDADTFLSRSKLLSDRLHETGTALQKARRELQLEEFQAKEKVEIVPKVETLLATYRTVDSPLEKNKLLKEVLEKAVYTKEAGGRWSTGPDHFEIVLYPKVKAGSD